tara:strand:- start:221 stop:415 length:195 start_codon:yes stop_codon:yes gene_type:complete
MSGKPKLDEFHYHEMLDRLHVMMTIADAHLQQHPVAKLETEVASHISSAVDHLWQAYQLIGNKT